MQTLDLNHHAGPVVVTIAYVLLYYAFLIHLMRVKGRLKSEYEARGEKFDRYFGQDRELLAADRFQLNMLEHMPAFLVLMWLNAVFIGPLGATIAGSVYLAARIAYPMLVGRRLGRGVPAGVLLATVPGYLVLAYLALALVVAMLT